MVAHHEKYLQKSLQTYIPLPPVVSKEVIGMVRVTHSDVGVQILDVELAWT